MKLLAQSSIGTIQSAKGKFFLSNKIIYMGWILQTFKYNFEEIHNPKNLREIELFITLTPLKYRDISSRDTVFQFRHIICLKKYSRDKKHSLFAMTFSPYIFH